MDKQMQKDKDDNSPEDTSKRGNYHGRLVNPISTFSTFSSKCFINILKYMLFIVPLCYASFFLNQ